MTSRTRTTLRAAAVATAVAVAVAAPGTATADFGRPFTVTRAGEQFPNGFSGAVNVSGTTAYAWTQRRSVRFRIRSAGGRLSRAVKVSTSGRAPFAPQVALDRRGNAVVVWHEQTGASSYRLYAAARPRARRFSAPQSLGSSVYPADALQTEYPLVAFDRGGNALASWRYPGSRIAVAWAAPGHRFARAQRLRGLKPLSVVFRADGSAAVSIFKFRGFVAEAIARPRGRFAVASDRFQLTASPSGIADVTAGQTPDSTALVAWREGDAGDPGVGPDPGPVHAATRPAGGAFGPEQVVSEPRACTGVASNTALLMTGAVTAAREALVTWEQCVGDPQDPASRNVFARRWSLAGGWEPVIGFGSRSQYGGPVSLAPGGAGELTLAWLAGDRDIAVSVMQPGGVFTPVHHTSSSGDARRTGPKATAAGARILVLWGSGAGYQALLGTTLP